MQIFARFFIVLLALANTRGHGYGKETKLFLLHKPSSTTPPPSPPVTHHLTTHATPPTTPPGTTPPGTTAPGTTPPGKPSETTATGTTASGTTPTGTPPSGTTAPGTTPPGTPSETTPPEITAPGTTPSGTPSETTASGTTAPGTTPPGTTPSGTTAPGTTPPGTPSETMPPGTTAPGTTPPGTTPPGTTPPETTTSETTPPGTTAPGTTPPGTTPPGGTPSGTTPPGTTTSTNPPDDTEPTEEEILQSFNDFKKNFNKEYSSPEEEQKRIQIYSDNYKKILELNKIENLPFELKINEYADLTNVEFNQQLNGLERPSQKSNATATTVKHRKTKSKAKSKTKAKAFDINKNVDWRNRGAVLPARNQGQCGSCYAFSSAAALEALFYVQTGKLVYLSTQQIVDCAKGYGVNNGCKGGNPQAVFSYVRRFGIDSEASYKYEAKDDKPCRRGDKVVNINRGSRYISSNERDGLERAVSSENPVVVGIDASARTFQFYSKGIYYEPSCDPTKINHAVLLIGYGTEKNGAKYWLIKNSYGTSWGVKGFGKIARNVSNHCGIRNYATYPI